MNVKWSLPPLRTGGRLGPIPRPLPLPPEVWDAPWLDPLTLLTNSIPVTTLINFVISPCRGEILSGKASHTIPLVTISISWPKTIILSLTHFSTLAIWSPYPSAYSPTMSVSWIQNTPSIPHLFPIDGSWGWMLVHAIYLCPYQTHVVWILHFGGQSLGKQIRCKELLILNSVRPARISTY